MLSRRSGHEALRQTLKGFFGLVGQFLNEGNSLSTDQATIQNDA